MKDPYLPIIVAVALLAGLYYYIRLWRLLRPVVCKHRWVSDKQITVLFCRDCPSMIYYEKGTYEEVEELWKKAHLKTYAEH